MTTREERAIALLALLDERVRKVLGWTERIPGNAPLGKDRLELLDALLAARALRNEVQ